MKLKIKIVLRFLVLAIFFMPSLAAVEEQSATTSEIARSIAEASKGTGSISTNIVGMAKAAEETSKGAGATQESASSLAAMATELNAVVANFKGNGNGH